MKIIESERLILRQLMLDDAPFIIELLNDEAFLQNIGDKGVRSLEDARGYITDGPAKSYQEHGFGLYLTELKDGNIPIGICGLLKRDSLDDVDIGYAFLPEFCGQGYASESTSAVMDFARTKLGIDRVVAVVSEGNAASIRVLEKLGLRFEKMMRLTDDADECMFFTPKESD
ncbi:MAG: N-acetyltransferase [Calditrichaeota bacterium]|nr:MAG: N-acetyltransferase [Calditrichota bacterium]